MAGVWRFLCHLARVDESKCNIIVGSLYKPPSISIYIFNKQLERVLDIILNEKKYVYYIGDFNIDTKHESQSVSNLTEKKIICVFI